MRRLRVQSVFVAVMLALAPSALDVPAVAAVNQWFKTDLHVHSVFSADAFPDLGIISQSAKVAGFNAIFLTDHNDGSNFAISGLTANNMSLTEAAPGTTPPRRWSVGSTGAAAISSNEVVTFPTASSSSTSSVHLTSASSSAAESFIYTKRGPLLRSSHAILKFAVDIQQLTGDSSVYVSVAIGGDPTIKDPSNNPVGYTSVTGGITPKKSNVLAWYFGSAPPPGFYGTARVVSHPLNTANCDKSFVQDSWITCSIDVTAAAQADIPAADQPLAYNGFSDLKMSAVGASGTAEAYFDDYSIEARSDSAEEFVYRTSLTDDYDTSTFKMFPSVEMGVEKHAQRFNFSVTDPSQFSSSKTGIAGIAPTQATGYPAQLNHPGVPGGVTDQEAIATNAEGAQLMEVRQRNMVDDWDAILRKGVPVVGTWGGDNHTGKWTTASQSTNIWAGALDFDSLMSGLRNGQVYLSTGVSGMTFNLDGSSTPYPAATPVTLRAGEESVTTHLSIGGGLTNGDTIRWLSNNGSPNTTSTVATDTVSGSSYTGSQNVAVGDTPTYIRVEVYRGATLRGMSEAIMLKRAAQDVAPTPPAEVTAVATGPTQVNVSWSASTDSDDTPVAGYRVLRDGVQVADVTAGTTASDLSVSADTRYSYTVAAYDTGGRQSTESDPSAVTTPPADIVSVGTFSAVADAYVAEGDAANHGSAKVLRVDATPVTSSYLRFNVSGLGGSSVRSATLRVYSTSALPAGFGVQRAGAGWKESDVVASTAPPRVGTTLSSGGTIANAYTSVDVTPLLTSPNGQVDLALTGRSATGLSLHSREAANKPQLVVATASEPTDDPPSVPTSIVATASRSTQVDLSWSASVDTDATPVAGYHVFRGGVLIADVVGTSFSDRAAVAGATNAYSVSAYDTASKESDQSSPTTVTTPPAETSASGAFAAVADAYVVAGETVSHGFSSSLRVDSSPASTSYLRFDVRGLSGSSVQSATLKVYTANALLVGFSVRKTSGGWSEAGLIPANAPGYATTGVNSGPTSANGFNTIDVTSVVSSSPGEVNLVLVGLSSTNLSLSSREGANKPQLLVTTR